ncbi:MAG: type III-A CRISPR-associated RAMP protein Csm3 [Planctomycetes bacterium]|nr:type III-A CRISPR-associated RAMP protein Csm3 [Planctomycetota bacterium]
MKIIEVKKITGKIKVETGLRIGGSAETMEISGIDNPIIRNPADNMPFLPGSSIKGKMRSLLEWHLGEVPQGGNVLKADENSKTAKVFGSTAEKGRGPTRLIVRDAPVSIECKNAFIENGQALTEVKSENSINRLTAKANPRPMERVVPGITFDFEILFRIIDLGDGGEEDESLFNDVVLLGLALLEQDALGGCGSRGCGRISLKELKLGVDPLVLPSLSGTS